MNTDYETNQRNETNQTTMPDNSEITDTRKLNHVSLCYGYGGIDLAIESIFGNRIRTILIAEIEAFAIENALAKMEEGRIDACPIWTDVRTIPWSLLAGKVDVLSGGFPCQPFSQSGRRQADSDPRHLFPAILDGIRVCRPATVFLENVGGIISAKLKGAGWRDPAGTSVLLHVLRELERVGYTATAGIFSAEEAGAPHQRKRVFILAYSNGAGSQGCEWIRETIAQGESSGHFAKCDGSLWPSRPGEAQYDWEPPRVI